MNKNKNKSHNIFVDSILTHLEAFKYFNVNEYLKKNII